MKMSAHEWQNLLNNLSLEESLDLSYQGLTDRDIPDLLSALEKNTSIRSLNLSFNNISNLGAKLLAENETLSSLNVSANSIDDEGAVAFLNNRTLTSLCFHHGWANQIGPEGAAALAADQTLWNPMIGDADAVALAMNLGANQIGPEGAAALAANQTLWNSMIGDADAVALAMNLGANQIGPEGATALAANQTITSLDLFKYGISDKLWQLIKNQLDLNARRIASENRFELFGFLLKKKIDFESYMSPNIFEMAGAALSRPTEIELKEHKEKVGQLQKPRFV